MDREDSEVRVFDGEKPSPERAEALLAKANLLRLRGDLAAAESICLDVLAAFPSDVYALSLLGDIRFSQERSHDAAHLYDLAVQTGGAPESVHRKLAAARVEPERRRTFSLSGWVTPIVGGLAFVGVIAIVVSIASHIQPANDPTSIRISAPKPESKPVTVEPTAPATPDPTPVSDVALAIAIEKRVGVTPRSLILTAEHDPRGSGASLTILSATLEDVRRLAATAGFFALENEPDLVSVTLRVVHAGRIVFVSDMTRQRIDDLRKSYAKLESEQWMLALSNEWPPNPRASTKDHP